MAFFWRVRAGGVAAAAALLIAAPHGAAQAQSAAKFFRGKEITLYIGFSAGGGYDLYARLLAQYMGPHIPGSPKIVPENMAGGGSRVAANYIFNAAPKDGTALATVDQAIPVQQAIGDPTVKFKTQDFSWIGNMDADNNVVVTWYTTDVKTIADAKKKSVTLGATGFNTSSQYPTALNNVIGTKFKIIFGYPGGNDINLAMERGEVGGRGSNSWASWKATRPEWVRDHKMNVLVQIGLKRAADLPNVPLLIDLAPTPLDKEAFTILSGPPAIGRPIFGPPGMPPDRVAALRKAFDDTMKDPAFLAAAKTAGLDLAPTTGQDLQNVVNEIVNAPKAAIDRVSQITTVSQGSAP
jgi:tripartite-type tricarboxylate transporter receptor subunit TctC